MFYFMTVRFFHTSDWHLGQFFYNHSRHYEHEQFLTWLLEQIKQKQPHALLIAGDIFDVINPSSQAQKQLYQFLADAHERAPHMQTLMIAGNHDSGYRIEQVEPLLAKYNAKTVGVIRPNKENNLDLDRLILPIYDEQKQIVAWCIALPFVRSAEITGFNEHTTNSQNAIAYLHQQLIAEAKRRKTDDQALILMSHAHMQGGETSDSERPIIIGNEEALSTSLFDDSIDYVALGHLHKPQKVGQDHIRYSGSPIPLSFSEINYKHQVLEVTIDPIETGNQVEFEAIAIPRAIQLHKIKGELNDVIQRLKNLPQGVIECIDHREYVDIEYHTATPPQPNLRQQFEDALPKDRYRLVRISRQYLSNQTNAEIESKINLEPPTPEKLFQQIWEKKGYSADDEVTKDFLSLVAEAQKKLEDDQTV
ncbi:exonuclease SbcCD subunit D C-terminal domain-containing protein [Acinetobacter junii]|uniref:Nuclease SbcCD subunit D n=2 Tax=Moraxellaceae TaxID=468 RepID=A0A8F6LQC7_ACIJU|nr:MULTISPECIES: exonuclease SbcCD subunit D [Acinetobacter]MDI6620173.1 exonuclease SbcCD subunit D C-terminal domain-containing protein [Acinetobacter junii]QUS51645.1 exonuclease SbcCD subunit D C-terminal domain-containing protein [Acinetobacter junii]QXR12157.1 exonuclease SbcCD subunit D C-terminal domain-containing protein [Acinetobacter junii]QXR29277.1 exonuclease SbcCD subunit D C-terminal domain-containing protein [Acinetobacter junii]